MSLESDITALLGAQTDDFEELLALCDIDVKKDLVGADLAGLDLSRVNFRGALLEEVELSGATLNSANRQSCDLTSADLSGASLIDVNAVGAVFRAAHLGHANFSRGDFASAIFSDSIIDECIFARVNLGGALMNVKSARNAVFHECDGLDEANARSLRNAGAHLTGQVRPREEAPLGVRTRNRRTGTG